MNGEKGEVCNSSTILSLVAFFERINVHPKEIEHPFLELHGDIQSNAIITPHSTDTEMILSVNLNFGLTLIFYSEYDEWLFCNTEFIV